MPAAKMRSNILVADRKRNQHSLKGDAQVDLGTRNLLWILTEAE